MMDYLLCVGVRVSLCVPFNLWGEKKGEHFSCSRCHDENNQLNEIKKYGKRNGFQKFYVH